MGAAAERAGQASVKDVSCAAARGVPALAPSICSIRSITLRADTFSMQIWPCRQRLSWRSKQGEQGTPARNAPPGRPYGPIQTGSVGPNTPTTGRSSATARCIGPKSLATLMAERRMSPASSVNVVSPARSTAPGASRATSSHTVRSRRLPTRATAKSLPMKCRATSANLPLPQCLVSQIVPGAMVMRGDPARPCLRSSASTLAFAACGRGKEKSGGPSGRFEHRTDAEVTIDRVNIEIRYRNMVCVGKPAALARALPRMFARFGGKGTRCRSPHACPRPVEIRCAPARRSPARTRRCGVGHAGR